MIPVTVIGGFLGAGKTTLVNHLLRRTGRRYAVLVNDFGAVNIDAALIASESDAVIALTNGCVCCTIGDDLGAALAALGERMPAPEHVIIEASGVADPWGVALLCLIEPGFVLGPILAVVDSAAFAGQLADPYLADTVRSQLARADIVVLNKCDCAAASERRNAAEIVARLRPEAAMIEAAHGDIPEIWLDFPASAHRPQGGDVPAGHAHPFRSFLWCDDRPFDRERLLALLGRLPGSVLRVKGWCRIGPAGDWRLINYAGGRWNLTPAAPPPDSSVGGAALVLIGTPALPAPDALGAMFAAALL